MRADDTVAEIQQRGLLDLERRLHDLPRPVRTDDISQHP